MVPGWHIRASAYVKGVLEHRDEPSPAVAEKIVEH
jgi:hypothetical protein